MPPETGHPVKTEPAIVALWNSAWPVLLGFGLAFGLHFALPPLLGPYYSRIVLDAGLAMLLAVSLNIVNGMTGQFSLGHAGFMALGGYTAAFITYYTSLWLWDSTGKQGGFLGVGEMMFAVSCLVGGLVAGLAGFVVGLPSLRLRGDYLAIVTLGFGEIVRVCLQETNPTLDSREALASANWRQLIPPPTGGSLGFNGVPKYTSLFWVFAALAVAVIIAYRLKYSSLGRAMISIREDEIASRAMGVDVTRQKIWAFILAAFLAGCGGGLYAHENFLNILPQDAGFLRSFDYIIMVVLGGKGSITGVMIAAIAVSSLPELLREFANYRLIVFAALLVLMMIVRPQGLLGVREIWEFWPFTLLKRKPPV